MVKDFCTQSSETPPTWFWKAALGLFIVVLLFQVNLSNPLFKQEKDAIEWSHCSYFISERWSCNEFDQHILGCHLREAPV